MIVNLIDDFEDEHIFDLNLIKKIYDYIKIKYHFHGGGCEIIQNNIICDYDIVNYGKDFKFEFSI